MDHSKHVRADNIRSKIAEIKEMTLSLETTIKCGTNIEMNFDGKGISLNSDHSDIIRRLASFLQKELDDKLGKLEAEYEKL